MEELTTEQKAQRYDEALVWMQDLYPTMEGAMKEDAENYFPELKENKDEKIRKALIRFHKSTIDIDGIKGDDIVAWLEKQKVLTAEEYLQGKEDVLWCIKQAEKHAKDENEMGTCWFAEKWLEKQGNNPTPINIDKMVMEYSQTKDSDFGMPVNCMIRAYRRGIIDVLNLSSCIEKQNEQNHANSTKTCKNEPKFHKGDWVTIKQ